MPSLLDDLNPAQREAVTHGEGPLLVLAGAGSGKTRVLTYRIAHLLAEGRAKPFEITAVTFTNKAAREMRERVERLVGGALPGGFVGTFHRWALQLLRRHPQKAGLPERFAIADTDDQRALVSQILKDEGCDPREYPPRLVLGKISHHVNRGIGPDGLDHDPTTARIWRRYRDLKSKAGVVDFDDMLVRSLDLLRGHPGVRRDVRRFGTWLLVDEFQDTNRLQMELLDEALGGERNITAVGDEDQSIYRWRGAELANILEFERHYPGACVVSLEQNYRSSAPILEVSGGLISHNHGRRGKRLFTSREGGEPVTLYVGEDERAEARWAADRIDELSRSTLLGEIAVLVRTNAQTRPFEGELTRRRVPHRVIGGLRFWQREEVKHALAYLRLVIRENDLVAFRRVVNVPARGVGAATIDVLERHAEAVGLPLPEAARQMPEALTRRARIALEGFFGLLDEARTQQECLEPGDFVGWLIESAGLLVMYEGDDEERIARRENLGQLAAAVVEADQQGQGLADLLDAVALLGDGDTETSPDSVSLMTLHSAKGLEFDAVFVAGLEDGLLPHANSRDDGDGLEEERRLTYVGMTRARHWLSLTAARNRFLFGTSRQTQPSRFLAELPEAEINDVSDVALYPGPQPFSKPHGARSPRTSRSPNISGKRPSGIRPSGRRPAATAVDAGGVGWRPGDRVRHRSFGDGVVLKTEGSGDHLKLVVYFDRAGRKTLVPAIAKLEKL